VNQGPAQGSVRTVHHATQPEDIVSDLRLEGTLFENPRKTFSTANDRMDAARRTLRGTDGSVVGSKDLVDGVDDFADGFVT
jgi:hypothetical protein